LPVHSGSKHDRELYDDVWDELNALQFDETSSETYNVLLSFPDTQKPNFVRFFQVDNVSQSIASEGLDGHSKHNRGSGFVGYSPSANITVLRFFSISINTVFILLKSCICGNVA
jgi:hypothetical protein